MSVTAFVQSRMLSSRLLGKALLPLHGAPMLMRVVGRVRQAKRVDRIVVVTGESPSNDAIRAVCQQYHVDCFSGHDTDLLERFVAAKRVYDDTWILRITADCPLIDPWLLDRLVKQTQDARADYGVVVTGASDVGYPRYADGLDAELLSDVALRYAYRYTTKPSDREHVTRVLWRMPRPLPTKLVIPAVDEGHERWTVDTLDDYVKVAAAYAALGPQPTLAQVRKWVTGYQQADTTSPPV